MQFKDLDKQPVKRLVNASPTRSGLRTLPNLPSKLLPESEPACWDCPRSAWYLQHDGPRMAPGSSELKDPLLMCFCLQLHMITWAKAQLPLMECAIRERALLEHETEDAMNALL